MSTAGPLPKAVIRHLTYQDITHVVADDLALLMSQLTGREITVSPEDLRKTIRDENIVFIAEAGNVIIGTATLGIFASPLQQLGTVGEVVVAEDFRELGVGNSLMDEVIAHSRQRKDTGMILTSSADREAAHAFYLKKGFTILDTTVFVLAH